MLRSGSLRAKQAAVGAGLLALAAFLFWQTQSLPQDGGYAGISARTVPLLIEAGLALCGLLLLTAALRGRWVGADEAQETRAAPAPWALLWVLGGLLFQMLTIAVLGFVPTSALMFACVATGFREQRSLRAFAFDLLLGLILALVIWVIFTQGLNLNLQGFFRG